MEGSSLKVYSSKPLEKVDGSTISNLSTTLIERLVQMLRLRCGSCDSGNFRSQLQKTSNSHQCRQTAVGVKREVAVACRVRTVDERALVNGCPTYGAVRSCIVPSHVSFVQTV